MIIMSFPKIKNIFQCLNFVKEIDHETYKTIGQDLATFFNDRGQEMPQELADFTSHSVYSDDMHYNAVRVLRNLAKGSYNDYQAINIIEPGMITLLDHTKTKYEIAKKHLNSQIESVLDAGCSLGGIGLKLATIPGVTRVVLDNLTVSELDTAREIGDKLGLTNVEFTSETLTNLDINVDMGLYFAIFHHLLRNNSIDELMQLVLRQVNKIAVIELPIKGDALLDMIVSTCDDPWNTRYSALSSVDALKMALGKYFVISEEIKMDYGSGDLNRHAFVCYIK